VIVLRDDEPSPKLTALNADLRSYQRLFIRLLHLFMLEFSFHIALSKSVIASSVLEVVL